MAILYIRAIERELCARSTSGQEPGFRPGRTSGVEARSPAAWTRQRTLMAALFQACSQAAARLHCGALLSHRIVVAVVAVAPLTSLLLGCIRAFIFAKTGGLDSIDAEPSNPDCGFQKKFRSCRHRHRRAPSTPPTSRSQTPSHFPSIVSAHCSRPLPFFHNPPVTPLPYDQLHACRTPWRARHPL